MSDTILWVDVDLVEEPTHLLRPVDESSAEFLATVASMKRDGYWASRPIEVTDEGDGTYQIAAEGLHRKLAAKAAGLKQVAIKVLEKSLTPGERLQRQVVAEATHTQAKMASYGKALQTLRDQPENREIAMVDFAKKVCQDVDFVQKALKLGSLPESVRNEVDAGKIRLGNGQALVMLQRALSAIKGLPQDQVEIPADALEKARREDVGAFTAWIGDQITIVRAGQRARREPAARLRPLADVKDRLERARKDPNVHPEFIRALLFVLRKDDVTAAAEGLEATLVGDVAESAKLRAEAAKMEALADEQRVLAQAAKARADGLERQVESLARELEAKEAVIKSLEKHRERGA